MFPSFQFGLCGLEPGILTSTGVLYEGNYEEWSRHVKNIIYLHDLGSFALNEEDGIGDNLPLYDKDYSQERNDHSITIICSNVSPALLTRVPDADRDNAERLWKALKALAQPFRLLDLPENVRSRVYQAHARRHRFPHHHIGEPDPLPPITQVSRPLRNETLVPFYSTTKFMLRINLQEDKDPGQNVTRAVLSWTEEALAENVKHIRSFYLFFNDSGSRKEHCCISFDFSREHGLDITSSASVGGPMRRKLKHYGATIEATRKALGLQGEAIILALVSKPELWTRDVSQ